MSAPHSTPPISDFLATHGLVAVDPRPIPDAPQTVARLIDDVATAHSNAPALADRRVELSYLELRESVDRAADVLARAGVRSLDRVAMSLPNTVDAVVAFLAVMRMGAIWVGINTNLAAPEKQFLLNDSGASVLVATEKIAAEARGGSSRLCTVEVHVEDPGGWWAHGSPDHRRVEHIDANAPAAIAYTSGTTGRPKGVVHSQHNIVLPAAVGTRAEPQPMVQGTILPLTILNMQVLSTVQSLLCGGVLVPIDRIDAVGVASWIAEFGVQRMYATPPTVYDLLTRPDIEAESLDTLTHLGVGGAKCPEGLRERYRDRFGRDFVFGYGLTEAPTGVTGGAADRGPVPIGASGVAREHVEVTVRSPDGAVLPRGQDGEICIGPTRDGRYADCYSTMLGYWNHPERTNEALRGGVLHTGDVGRIDADGVLWVLDRRSDLIIRGGANVYPAEVERVIESLPAIAEVAVVSRDDPRLGEEVVAVVRLASGVDPADVERQQLVDACRTELAKYKVPVDWFVIDEFPRNAMGKVLKPSLRSWLRGDEWPGASPEPRPLG